MNNNDALIKAIEKLENLSNRYEVIDGQYVIRKNDFDNCIEEIKSLQSQSVEPLYKEVDESINENSYLFGICQWIQGSEEYKSKPITNQDSIFYHVAPLTYAKLIYKYLQSSPNINKDK